MTRRLSRKYAPIRPFVAILAVSTEFFFEQIMRSNGLTEEMYVAELRTSPAIRRSTVFRQYYRCQNRLLI